MSAGEFALVVASVLGVLAFVALVLTLLATQRVVRELRGALGTFESRAQPLVVDLEAALAEARADLDRFDRVLGSAEAISSSVEGASKLATTALSTPIIKTVALASGTGRAARRLRGREDRG